MTEIQYPDGVQLTSSYDLNKKTGYVVKQLGSSVNLTVSGLYNNRNQITDLNISGAKMPSTQHVKYDYWKNGIVAKRQVAGAFAANMQYENDKVSQIQYDKGAQSLNQFKYEYDLNDNVMSRNENNYVTNFSYTPLDQVKTSSEFNERYTYDGRYNRLTLESSRELSIQEAQYEYNQKNQLTKTIGAKGTASYSYNGDGLMVERAVSNARHRYYYNEDKRIVAEAVIEADGKPRILYVYIYDTNGAIIGRQDAASGKVQYYQLNGHGDVVALTDEQGSMLNEYRYDIWGLPLESKETVPNIFGYAGEYWDSVSDLQYLRARWYDPSMGRFISEDKNQGKIEEPDTLNRYTYVENNPLNGVDPTGEYRLECAFRCFSAGTQIQTDEGLKAIEDIQVGDKVLAKSEETGETAYKAVEETFNRTADEVYVIEVKQEKITTTEEHPFWIKGKGWVEAGDLSVGDKLVDRDGQEYPIESITVRTEPTKVYNFRVQGYHNYFVTDLRIWTHNCGGGGFGRAGAGSSTSSIAYSSPGSISRGSNLAVKNVPIPEAFKQQLLKDPFNSFNAFKGTGKTTDAYGGYYVRKEHRTIDYQNNVTNPMTKAQLPNKGSFRFIPGDEVKFNKNLGGYVDKFGNVWKKGPYHGDPNKIFNFEWDVQLSKQGIKEWGSYSKNKKNYINVAPDGTISH